MFIAARHSDKQLPSTSHASSPDWHEAPLVDEQMLTGTFWSLSALQDKSLSPFLVLAPEGRVGNFFHPDLDMWQVVNGRLCFINARGLPTIIFNVVQTDQGRIETFAGRGVIDGLDAIYAIARTDHPVSKSSATGLSSGRRANFIKTPAKGPLRPNLVVVPANAQSLHPNWFSGVTDVSRNWDLCVGFYGPEQPIVESPHEYLAHLPGRRKFKLLSDLFYEGSPLWNYDRIWLPDDDLMASGSDLNQMFHLSRRYGLDLSQPALRQVPDCHINHPLTAQSMGSVVRYTPFVEIMCPLFSARALRLCIGSIKDSESGYGLDHLWPGFLGRPEARIGIIDAVGIVHTRPIGATYDVRGAIAEQSALWQAYGFQYVPVPGVK